MDKIDALIKKLTDFKEELNKNVNMSYSGGQNVAKEDEVIPDSGYGKITIKDSTPKPVNGEKPNYGKIIQKEEMEKDAANPALAPKEVKIKKLKAQIDAGTYKPDSKKIAGAMLKEELMCSENGQWNIKVKS